MAILYFLRYSSKILHKKFQVISTKNEGMTAIFPNFNFILNRKNQRHAFIFAQNNLKFFVQNLRNITHNQSCTNFQFSQFKVQGLDIETLLGAEGPPQGPQGPKGPEGPSALRRSQKDGGVAPRSSSSCISVSAQFVVLA